MSKVVGVSNQISISRLRLDKENPRFQSGVRSTEQVDLANKLIMAYDVFQIAKSIAKNGYFAPSPMVAVESEEEQGAFVVVEGNRRLTALKALSDPAFRSKLYSPHEWNVLAEGTTFTSETELPVVCVDKSEVELLLGYRHISGDLPWQPLAQARWVARVVDDLRYSFEEAAYTSGKTKADIIAMYRNQAIVKQAVELGFPSAPIEANFSMITVAMTSPALRDFVEAPSNSTVIPGSDPIPTQKSENLKEMLSWLYGDESRGQAPVVPESRHISKLGKVVQDLKGLAELRKTNDLAAAEQAASENTVDPLIVVKNRLSASKRALELASDDIRNFSSDGEVLRLFGELESLVTDIRVDFGE